MQQQSEARITSTAVNPCTPYRPEPLNAWVENALEAMLCSLNGYEARLSATAATDTAIVCTPYMFTIIVIIKKEEK